MRPEVSQSRVLPPSQIMHRRHLNGFGDVPLSAIGSRGLTGLQGRHLPAQDRRRSWGCALRSFDPAGGWRSRFRAAGPTCHLPGRPARRVFHRGIGRRFPHAIAPPFSHYGRSIRDVQVGFWDLAPQAIRTRRFPVGPILPWAFGLSQAFGSSSADQAHAPDGSGTTMTLAKARLLRQAIDLRSGLSGLLSTDGSLTTST
jgi:hypothetical protein